MSRKDDEAEYALALSHHKTLEMLNKYKAKQSPVFTSDLDQLAQFEEISFEDYRKLSKRQRDDYFYRKGCFDPDPVKREGAREFYKRHRFWDYARVVMIAILIGVVVNDLESLMMPTMLATIAVFIIAHIRAGEWGEL